MQNLKKYKKRENKTKIMNKVIHTCENCGLSKTCLTPKMPVTGKGGKKILIVAEAPGKLEDEKGKQLIGQAGQLLRKYLSKLGIDLDFDCWKTNAVICRPPGNKTPTVKQINCCRQHLFKAIEKYKPEKIILLGKIALQSFLGNRTSISGIEKYTGHAIPDQDYGCWVFPIYHPSYILRNDDNVVLKNIFEDNLRRAIEHTKEFPNYRDIENNVKIINNCGEAIIVLENITDWSNLIAFDYETTGLKPHRKGHKIKCISIAISSDECFVFPMFENPIFIKSLQILLYGDAIKKIAHNIKFEDTWTRFILGEHVQGWVHDTSIAAHILNSKTGKKLKFQSYVNFGIIGYDNEIKDYLDSKSKNSNEFNNIEKADLDKLLLYCGMDSLLTFMLYEKQKKMFNENNQKTHDFLLTGAIELSKIESNGIHVDLYYALLQKEILEKKLQIIKNNILHTDEVRQWPHDNFNFNSTKQLSELLFNILGHEPVKTTATGNPSVDQESLEKIRTKLTRYILKHKKLEKLQKTYLDGFIRETIIEPPFQVMRPNFHLTTVTTYRSSSSNPNFQNIPKRDELAQRIIRSCIIPRLGRQILEVDYSGIEVRISACYHKDPTMLDYIHDPDSDMHRDLAMQLFQVEKENVTKNQRHLSKNGFVFPQFYGSYYVNCAANIWSEIDSETKNNLKKKGIKNYMSFENHVKDIEYYFWNERFAVYNSWKKLVWKQFQKRGYIKTKLGFYYGGNLTEKEVTNYPIQGTAFHCLLWSLIQLNRWIMKKGFASKLIGQIHDSIVIDLVPHEKSIIKEKIRSIMCDEIREKWDWMITPLDIEAEITEIDGSWYQKKGEKI